MSKEEVQDSDVVMEHKEEKEQPKHASIFNRRPTKKLKPASTTADSSTPSASSAATLNPPPPTVASSSTSTPTSSPEKRPGDSSTLPWVEKYRPSGLDQLISHHEIINTIQSLIAANRLPHMLLYGPPGTGQTYIILRCLGIHQQPYLCLTRSVIVYEPVCIGKTSTILAIARQLYGSRYPSHILELNASDDRGIEVVREQIMAFASSKQLFSSGYKVIVLDEADQMTKTAQFALRRVIEKYTRGTRFCLICNYVNKIIPALQSRCTKFRFGPLDTPAIEGKLRQIAAAEKVELTDDGLQAIVKLSEGDMRKCLNILQSTSMAASTVDEAAVYNTTGNPLPADILLILQALLNSSLPDSYALIRRLQVERGLSLQDIVQYLHELVLRTEMPDEVLGFLLREMCDAQYRLASGTSEAIQLAGVCGIFATAKEMVHQVAQAETAKAS